MDVLCIGHAAWDISLFLDGYPAENSKWEVPAMLECGGGPAANAAYLLSRWGIRCGIAAAIGADTYGDRIAVEFLAAGTDIRLLERSPENATPVSVILANQCNGSRTIVNRKGSRIGAPFRLSFRLPIDQWPRVLLFDGHELEASLHAIELFPEARTILDAGSLRDGTRELAKSVDFLVASDRFACQFSGVPDLDSPQNQARAMEAMHAQNGRPVTITRGERGMLYGTPQSFRHYPAFEVRAVDTTAAGDTFHGAFAYGVLMGLPIEQTLRMAAAAAALSVTVRGGRPSIPSLSRVEEMLRHAG